MSMASQITLHFAQDKGAVGFAFSPEAARELQASLKTLLESLKAIAARANEGQTRRPQEPTMEFRHVGEVWVEVFCNPNIWPSPFAAKLMVTIRDDRIRFSSEAELPRLIEDLNLYLEQVA